MLPFVFLRHKDRFVKIFVADILYIEAAKNYVKIFTMTQTLVVLTPLQRLERALPAGEFIRIHRSFLVALSRVVAFDRRWVYLPDKKLPVGETYRASLDALVLFFPEPKTHPHAPATRPVLMLYDPEEFWCQVRATVREELAGAHAQQHLVQTALEKAGLPVKPAYTMSEIQQLFQLSDQTLDEWTRARLLKPTRISRQTYILYADLLPLFK